MKNNQSPNIGYSMQPTCIASGFIALDKIIIGSHRKLANENKVGGSCGNVVAILSYLQWRTMPVMRLNRDHNAKIILDDYKGLNVDLKFVQRVAKPDTPVVVHRVLQDGAVNRHRFEFRSPLDGSYLPRFSPMPKRLVKEMLSALPPASVFYFDRATPATLLLAEHMEAQGALVIFEPSNMKDQKLFYECLSVSHVVKYSSDRMTSIPDIEGARLPLLEIRTIGSKGLQLRLKDNNNRFCEWKLLPSYRIDKLEDAAGAGDWCTATMISQLGRQGAAGIQDASIDQIESALSLGQAYAAINCQYVGARGAMYQLTRDELHQEAMKLERYQAALEGCV